MRFLAGVVMALGAIRASIAFIATIMDIGTASERVDSNFDAIIIFVLGAILWQLTQLLNRGRD